MESSATPTSTHSRSGFAKAPTTLSPTRFHNSVHNAAAGYWSIATGCHQPYSALGAGRYTFANGLFAAALQVCADHGCDPVTRAHVPGPVPCVRWRRP